MCDTLSLKNEIAHFARTNDKSYNSVWANNHKLECLSWYDFSIDTLIIHYMYIGSQNMLVSSQKGPLIWITEVLIVGQKLFKLCYSFWSDYKGSNWLQWIWKNLIFLGPPVSENNWSPIIGVDRFTDNILKYSAICFNNVCGREDVPCCYGSIEAKIPDHKEIMTDQPTEIHEWKFSLPISKHWKVHNFLER